VPRSRLVFPWEAPWSAPGTEVERLLTPVPGGTEVVLAQVPFLSEESPGNHLQSWAGILERLAAIFAA
jgi:uncharacterized protein YndB with AHSA1/START domain